MKTPLLIRITMLLSISLSVSAFGDGLALLYQRKANAFFAWHGFALPDADEIGWSMWKPPQTVSVSNDVFSVSTNAASFVLKDDGDAVVAEATFHLDSSARNAWLSFAERQCMNSLPDQMAFGRVQAVWSNDCAVVFCPTFQQDGSAVGVDRGSAVLLCSNLTIRVSSSILPASDIAVKLISGEDE